MGNMLIHIFGNIYQYYIYNPMMMKPEEKTLLAPTAHHCESAEIRTWEKEDRAAGGVLIQLLLSGHHLSCIT